TEQRITMLLCKHELNHVTHIEVMVTLGFCITSFKLRCLRYLFHTYIVPYPHARNTQSVHNTTLPYCYFLIFWHNLSTPQRGCAHTLPDRLMVTRSYRA